MLYSFAPDSKAASSVIGLKADRFINKVPAQDRAIELQCVGYHAEELKNKDFIDQFPISPQIDELDEESEKILAIGTALNQYSEDGGAVIYTEEIDISPEDNEGRTLKVINDPLLIEEQENLIQIDLDSETQFIFKPCQDKSEYNRSIKLLDTSGMVSLEEATRKSINTVYAQLASELGGEKLSSTANRIGIDSELDPVISLTLGAGAVTPIELASAYSSFANNGYLAPTYLIEKITDANGQVLYQHVTSQRVTIPDPGAAAAVRKTLEVAAQFGTGTRAVLDDRPIAGKTGTHQGFREAWFIGFIPQYTSSVWIGFAEEQLPLTDVEINGEVVSNVSGGRVPAPIWKEFMEKVVEDLPIEDWPSDPSDIEKYYEIPTIEIPQLLGLNIIDAEEIAFSGYILPTIKLVDSEEAPGLVLTQSIESGEEMPEGTEIVLEVSGTKFTAAIPNIPPCVYTKDEAQVLIKDFMRETSVIIFLKNSFEESEIPNCQGKVIGTNIAQGGTVSTGDSLIFIIASSQSDS